MFVGTLKQSEDELAANIQAVLTRIVSSIPEGFKNIRIASIKTEDSLSVPIIVSFGMFFTLLIGSIFAK